MEERGEECGALVGMGGSRGGDQLEGEVGEVGHLGGAGVGVEEVEDMGVEGWEAVTKGEAFHGGEKTVGGFVV